MDRQLLERMIGAGVLIVALILIVPAILDGQRDVDTDPGAAIDSGEPLESDELTRTHTMRLDRQPDTPPMAREKTPTLTEESVEPIQPPESVAKEVVSTAPSGVSPKSTDKSAVSNPDEDPVAAEPSNQDEPAQTVRSAEPVIADAPPQKGLYQVPDSGWAVQLGSFGDRQNAERLATTVSQNGFTAYLMPLKQPDKTLYRVRVGPRDSREKASELADRLAKNGYKGQVVQQRPDS